MDKDLDFLRTIIECCGEGTKAKLREIADEYERMKHDLERHVKIAATIGDVEDEAYRLGWQDGRRETLTLAARSADVPRAWLVHKRLKERKGDQ